MSDPVDKHHALPSSQVCGQRSAIHLQCSCVHSVPTCHISLQVGRVTLCLVRPSLCCVSIEARTSPVPGAVGTPHVPRPRTPFTSHASVGLTLPFHPQRNLKERSGRRGEEAEGGWGRSNSSRLGGEVKYRLNISIEPTVHLLFCAPES